MSYRFVPEQTSFDFPPRVKDIADEFARHGFEYRLDQDNDMESWKEMGFEKRAKERPETVKKEIICVYRIRDESTDKEYMIYKVKKSAAGGDSIAVWMGKKPRFDVVPVVDGSGAVINKRITRWNMVYTIEWSLKAFDDIMKDSDKKNTRLYIADASEEYHTNWTGTSIMIKDSKKFRELSHEELIMYDENLKVENQAKLPKFK
ncbi:hypothetical protein [Serratia sp. (in: enterobacteria)]|uniref:hypothetical protein n=1 Tax=Serratia sp. (in: enterobacteria) TaxID=616 RepID=UPI003988DCD1